MVKRANRDKREVDPSHNDVTGDRLISKLRNKDAYADGWDRIWGKKEDQLESDFEEKGDEGSDVEQNAYPSGKQV